MASSKVTTKRGDTGTAGTLGGDRYPKSHPIFECCGQLDTLRAQTALCRLMLMESDYSGREHLAEFLLWVLHINFLMGSQCNDPLNKHPEFRKMDVSRAHLTQLESEQARLEGLLKLPNKFIVSASNPLAAQFDLACTFARTFERSVVRLKEAMAEFDSTAILPFANRLSDTLFIIARVVENGKHTIVDYDLLRDA